MKDSVTDSEIRTRVTGVDATVSKFSFLFGLVLAEKLLQHTDNLSQTLQASSLTASEGQEMANLTCTTLSRMRSTEAYDLFWERILQLQKEFGINEACLPRKRKASRHLEVGESTGYFHSTSKALYSQEYFAYIVRTIRDHFDQPGYKVLQQLENLLIKVSRGENYQDELDFTVSRFGDDIVPSSLETQLGILNSAFADMTPTFAEIWSYLLQLSDAQCVSVSEVCTVLKLILLMPATNAISERSASALRRVKVAGYLVVITIITNHASRLVFRNDPDLKWLPQSMYYA